MKRIFIYSDTSLGYGELKEAEFAVIGGEVVKDRTGDLVGEQVEPPKFQVGKKEIRVIFKRRNKA